jgi:predicted ester cyclase
MDAIDTARVGRELITALWAGRTDAAHDHPGYWPTLHTFQIVLDAFPDLEVVFQRQLVEGDIVVSQVGLMGTHQAPFFGAEGTGRKVEWTIVYVDTFRDGKVVEHASGDGWLDVLIAVGAVPPPG